MDRQSLKGKACFRVFDIAFKEACKTFYQNLHQKAYEMIKEKEHFNDISDKTLDSIFESSNEVLEDLLDHMESTYDYLLEKRLQEISNAIASKAWDKDGGSNFRKSIHDMREQLYKKTFAKFYHDESFIRFYITSYGISLSCFLDKTLFFSSMPEALNEDFMLKLLGYIKEEIYEKVNLTQDHLNSWSNWLKEEKLNPRKPSRYCNTNEYIIWPFSAI